MNKKNNKIVQELKNWAPLIVIGVVVIVLVAAMIANSGFGAGTGAGDDVGIEAQDSELGLSFEDENGNALEVTDWTEVDEEYVDEEPADGGLDMTE